MTNEEIRDECIELEKQSNKVLKNVEVTVHFRGDITFEFENVTLEEARRLAEEEYYQSDLKDANFEIEEIV